MIALENTNEEIRKLIYKINRQGRQCTLIVYCSSHSVKIHDKHTLLCDSSDKGEVFFNIELKLRTLTEEYEHLDVFAIHNCSRHKLESFNDLANARQVKVSSVMIQPEMQEQVAEDNKIVKEKRHH